MSKTIQGKIMVREDIPHNSPVYFVPAGDQIPAGWLEVVQKEPEQPKRCGAEHIFDDEMHDERDRMHLFCQLPRGHSGPHTFIWCD